MFWNFTEQYRAHAGNNDSNSTNISGISQIPESCFLLQFEEFVPWNNPDSIISLEVEDLVRKLNAMVFLPALFLIGCPANIINMAVFYKQGLKERINVCLFALSLADELHLVHNIFFFGDQLYLQFTTKEIFGPVMKFMANHNLVGFYGFVWVSQILSAIIAGERLFCVLQPLRSQIVLRTSTMTVIIIGVFLVMLTLFFVVATRYRIQCTYDSASNSTSMAFVASQFYFQHEKFINDLDSFVLGAAFPGVVMMVVLLTTLMTAIKLRQAAAWRAEVSGVGLSQRDFNMTKMLVANSIFFIACVFPFSVIRLVIPAMPEVNTGRRQHNLYMTFQWLMISVSYVNTTFNIIVYYTMGSRYRQTFWQLFGRRRIANKQSVSIIAHTISPSISKPRKGFRLICPFCRSS